MAKRIIECQVNDEYVLGSGVVVGAAGSHDDVVLRLAFGDDMWVGLNIYATFHDANGENPVHSMLMASMLVPGEAMTYDVTIPPEAKRYAGKMMLTLTGYSIVDGVQEDMATNTTTAYFRVLPSDFAPLDDGTITPTLAQQVQDEMREYGKAVEEQLATILDVATAEEKRKDAEDKRKAAEETRGAAETARIDAENKRKTAEAARVTAEEGRAAAEVLRVKADGERGEFLGDLYVAVEEILDIQEEILNGDAELIAKEEVIKAINETLLIADDLETDDPYKALSAAQGVVLKDRIEEVFSDCAEIESGSYVGTGRWGEENANVLAFSFKPKMVILDMDNSTGNDYDNCETVILMYGHSKQRYVADSDFNYAVINIEWTNHSVKWWHTNDAGKQFNLGTYTYVAIG